MNDNHMGVLLEDIQDKLQRLAEGISDMHADLREVKTAVTAIPDITSDMKVIKAVVTDQSQQLNDHQHRIHRLESDA